MLSVVRYERVVFLARSDVYIPTKKYAQVVTNMNESKRRADSKLIQGEKGEVVLSKAERARYLSDKKTSVFYVYSIGNLFRLDFIVCEVFQCRSVSPFLCVMFVFFVSVLFPLFCFCFSPFFTPPSIFVQVSTRVGSYQAMCTHDSG